MLADASRAFGYEIGFRAFLALAEDGDPVCVRILGDAALRIGQAVAMICSILNPDAVVLGGALTWAHAPMVGEIVSAFQRFAVPTSTDVRILHADFGKYSSAMGAVALVLGQVRPTR
jgi:predicted NBD/HSP70 family sugar kinase